MPSFDQPIENNRIIILVDVAQGADGEQQRFQALLDTGATLTMISPKVIKDLGLSATGTASMQVASGESIAVMQYAAWVALPITYPTAPPPTQQWADFRVGQQLFVAGLPFEPDGFDVLLGMDFMGFFHTTIYRNRIILSN